MKILLKRHRRIGKKLHYRGSIIDVDDRLALEMIGRRTAVAVEPITPVVQGPPPVDPSLVDAGSGVEQSVDADFTDGTLDNDGADQPDEVPAADENAPRKPLKTDKLAVFQAWARHLGDNPDKTLAELKAKYL